MEEELIKRPSHGKLKLFGKPVLASSSWYVWKAQKQSENELANCWQQIELASILANFFALVNSNLTYERLANMCWQLSTNQNELYSRDLFAWQVTKWGRQPTLFKFIEAVHNCPAVWDVSSLAYRDTNKNKQNKTEERADKLGFVQTFL